MLWERTWRTEAVIRFCAAQMICFCLGAMAITVLQKAGVGFFQPATGFGVVLVGTLSFQGATWVLAPLFLRWHEIDWKQGFGLRGPRVPYVLLLAFLVTTIALPIAMLLQTVSIHLLTSIGWEAKPQDAVMTLLNAKTWWARAYLAFFAVICAPVAEEFIFRGVLYPFIKQLGFPRLAWILVSFIFASIHMNLPIFIPLFVLAMTWTWLYEKTGNLLAPIAGHCLFNAANLALYLIQP
jgi:membrane protease YdiL (CAAX protease family)